MSDILYQSPDVVLWQAALVSILVSYLLAQTIAFAYMLTHQGVSYSRSFVVSLVAAGMVSTVLMLAIGNNLARGVGIVGTLALIRFRMQMHDSLDMIYVFAAFAGGVAAGTGNFATGGIGTAAFLIVVSTLQLTGFGSRHRHDGVLRVQLPPSEESENALLGSLRSHCRQFAAITVREVAQGRELERIYQITLRNPGKEALLVREVAAIEGAHGVSIAMQEATHEI
jgi:putative flippase GtrA